MVAILIPEYMDLVPRCPQGMLANFIKEIPHLPDHGPSSGAADAIDMTLDTEQATALDGGETAWLCWQGDLG